MSSTNISGNYEHFVTWEQNNNIIDHKMYNIVNVQHAKMFP